VVDIEPPPIISHGGAWKADDEKTVALLTTSLAWPLRASWGCRSISFSSHSRVEPLRFAQARDFLLDLFFSWVASQLFCQLFRRTLV
jgi:hypothetical protein